MSLKTGIEWTDATWNPIRGCSLVSEGCRNCYAMGVAARFSGPGQAYEGLARRRSNGQPQWTGEIAVVERHMLDPLRWKAPRRIFVNSMSDLFHERVSITTIAEVFAVMGLARQHTHQVLTKRPERMQAVLSSDEFLDEMNAFVETIAFERSDSLNRRTDDLRATAPDIRGDDWPLKNVWLGVSVENQVAADERIPLLLQTPAAIRFLSCEPLLGPIDLNRLHGAAELQGGAREDWWESCLSGKRLDIWAGEDVDAPKVDWVIVGGESGRGTGVRPMHPVWARTIRDQCLSAGVPFFFKQWGEWAHRPGPTTKDEIDVWVFDDGIRMGNIGKRRAGRELDGRIWDAFPEPRA